LSVLILFGWLVSRHHDKLYAPTDYRDDDSFLKTIGQKVVSTEDSSKYVQDLLDYGGDFEIIKEYENLIEKDLAKRGLSHSGQTTKILVRQLAASQVINWFEKTYYTILGSQIELLKSVISSKDGLSKENVIEFFNRAQTKYPEILGLWDFDQYLKYLLVSNLLEIKANKYHATKRGEEFIKILSGSGYREDKNL